MAKSYVCFPYRKIRTIASSQASSQVHMLTRSAWFVLNLIIVANINASLIVFEDQFGNITVLGIQFLSLHEFLMNLNLFFLMNLNLFFDESWRDFSRINEWVFHLHVVFRLQFRREWAIILIWNPFTLQWRISSCHTIFNQPETSESETQLMAKSLQEEFSYCYKKHDISIWKYTKWFFLTCRINHIENIFQICYSRFNDSYEEIWRFRPICGPLTRLACPNGKHLEAFRFLINSISLLVNFLTRMVDTSEECTSILYIPEDSPLYDFLMYVSSPAKKPFNNELL